MLPFLGAVFGKVADNLAESFVDNIIRDKVAPAIGSILYCELVFGTAEHSGIYIGENKIVHLDGSGRVGKVSPIKFMDRLGGLNSAISIYVSCDGCSAVGSNDIAMKAKSMIGHERDYNLILNNCHQFASGCITGNFENSDNFLWMLKHTTEKSISANTWRVWDV